jgi:hypothetical protein
MIALHTPPANALSRQNGSTQIFSPAGRRCFAAPAGFAARTGKRHRHIARKGIWHGLCIHGCAQSLLWMKP